MGLTANYPKGSGDLFKSYVEEYHPGALLLHAKDAEGSRHDIVCEAAGPVHFNRKTHLDFLDWRLKSSDKENALEENLFV